MNKKKVCVICSIVVVVVFIVCLLFLKKGNDSSNIAMQYRLITDSHLTTMLNDGGSHINQYYEINFGKNVVIKYEDSYRGFAEVGGRKYTYKRKKLYEKKLSKNETKELNELINKIIDYKGIELDFKDYDFRYYTLIDLNVLNDDYNSFEEFYNLFKKEGSIQYNNYDVINQIEKLLSQD